MTLKDQLDNEQQAGKISVVVAIDGVCSLILSVNDPVKPEAALAIYNLEHKFVVRSA